MTTLCKRLLCLLLAMVMGLTVLPCAASAAATPALSGVWEANVTFPASDLGVSAPDIHFRCTMEFQPNGRVSARWTAVELSAIRLYFHQMFVNAYYACAYGAGITSFEAVEQFCMASTGMSVSDYMFSFLDQYDMYALFCPEPSSGTYRLNETRDQLYFNLTLMGNVSNPEIPNNCIITEDSIFFSLSSFIQSIYILQLDRVSPPPAPTVPPETEPPVTEPAETDPAVPDGEMEKIRVGSNTTITIREGQTVHLYCTYDESESYKIYEWEIQSGEDVISIDSEYRNCYVTGLEPGTAEIFMRYHYTYAGRDSLTGNPRRVASSKRRVYTIIVE